MITLTGTYLAHYLALAGHKDALIHQTSRGCPRAVNNLAIHALTATYAAGKAVVDERLRPPESQWVNIP